MSGNKNTTKKGPVTDVTSIDQLEQLVKKDAQDRVTKFTAELQLLQEKYGIDLLPQVTFTANLQPRYEVIVAARMKQ